MARYGLFYSIIENLILWARSNLNGFAGKDSELFWSTGVLEYWSGGKSQIPRFNLNESFHHSITPLLQQTTASRKDSRSTLWGQPKAGSSLWARGRARLYYFFTISRFFSSSSIISFTGFSRSYSLGMWQLAEHFPPVGVRVKFIGISQVPKGVSLRMWRL